MTQTAFLRCFRTEISWVKTFDEEMTEVASLIHCSHMGA